MKKLFISHASEDKDAFVRQLATALKPKFDVWYDEYKLMTGMSLLEEINKGLSNCDYGVVVLSNNFFSKQWPQNELDGLFSLEKKDKKVILPIWHNVGVEEVKQYSPILAGRVASKSKDGITEVVSDLSRSIAFFDRGKFVQSNTSGLAKLKSSLQRKAEDDRSQELLSSHKGVALAVGHARTTLNTFASQAESIKSEGFSNLRIVGPQGRDGHMLVDIHIGKLQLSVKYLNSCINSALNVRLQITFYELEIDWTNTPTEHTQLDQDQYSLSVTHDDIYFWKSEDDDKLYSPEDLVNYWFEMLAEEIEGA